jgi:DNA segregation ATPase FtsK/SpoIIIE, S-DNA-T family
MSNRSACKFPAHHDAGSGGSGVVVVLAAIVVLAVVAAVRFVVAHLLWFVVPPAALAVAVLAVMLFVRRPRIGLPRDLGWVRHVPRAAWAAIRWHHLTANLKLAYPDKHREGKIRRPRAFVLPSRHGVVAWVRTVPGSGRAEFDKAADHIGDYWRVPRVSVTQPRPGRLLVRGLAVDPLVQPFPMADVPAGIYDGRDLTRLYVGRDEHGQHRFMQVENNTAATFAGMPGSGKSVGINGLLMQWAPSPAVQFGTADGKAPADAGDYEPWRPRAWRSVGDSREDVADMLSDACAVMRERLGRVVELTGSRNAWHVLPSAGFPIFGLVLDEAQRFLDASAVKRDKDAERLVLHIQSMAGDIVRQGRSVLMFLILATQKATTDSLPSQIRDNAALSIALAQKTMAASKAALGDDIADYPAFAPTTLQGPEYVGCAVATLRTGQDPFTRIKFPEVTTPQLEHAAAEYAHLRKDPAALMPVRVPDDARELVG